MLGGILDEEIPVAPPPSQYSSLGRGRGGWSSGRGKRPPRGMNGGEIHTQDTGELGGEERTYHHTHNNIGTARIRERDRDDFDDDPTNPECNDGDEQHAKRQRQAPWDGPPPECNDGDEQHAKRQRQAPWDGPPPEARHSLIDGGNGSKRPAPRPVGPPIGNCPMRGDVHRPHRQQQRLTHHHHHQPRHHHHQHQPHHHHHPPQQGMGRGNISREPQNAYKALVERTKQLRNRLPGPLNEGTHGMELEEYCPEDTDRAAIPNFPRQAIARTPFSKGATRRPLPTFQDLNRDNTRQYVKYVGAGIPPEVYLQTIPAIPPPNFNEAVSSPIPILGENPPPPSPLAVPPPSPLAVPTPDNPTASIASPPSPLSSETGAILGGGNMRKPSTAAGTAINLQITNVLSSATVSKIQGGAQDQLCFDLPLVSEESEQPLPPPPYDVAAAPTIPSNSLQQEQAPPAIHPSQQQDIMYNTLEDPASVATTAPGRSVYSLPETQVSTYPTTSVGSPPSTLTTTQQLDSTSLTAAIAGKLEAILKKVQTMHSSPQQPSGVESAPPPPPPLVHTTPNKPVWQHAATFQGQQGNHSREPPEWASQSPVMDLSMAQHATPVEHNQSPTYMDSPTHVLSLLENLKKLSGKSSPAKSTPPPPDMEAPPPPMDIVGGTTQHNNNNSGYMHYISSVDGMPTTTGGCSVVPPAPLPLPLHTPQGQEEATHTHHHHQQQQQRHHDDQRSYAQQVQQASNENVVGNPPTKDASSKDPNRVRKALDALLASAKKTVSAQEKTKSVSEILAAIKKS